MVYVTLLILTSSKHPLPVLALYSRLQSNLSLCHPHGLSPFVYAVLEIRILISSTLQEMDSPSSLHKKHFLSPGLKSSLNYFSCFDQSLPKSIYI